MLLVAVYLAGWMFDGLVDKSPESNLDKPVEDANQTARRVLQFSLVHREPTKADPLLCDGFTGLTPKQLTKELTDWEASEGVLSEATVTFENVNGEAVDGGTLFPMRVELEVDPSFIVWNYDVTVKPDGDSFCVSKVENVTSDD
ncbi:hypothetical protein [Stackebrandtia nassauensis]|uniref:hypothetical protein n=1 Tax=Stackebrandtia nassauensis TaxID=283811 RepID=UPI0001A39E8E|nr:hypothetical protein [Stackebrandtia nassauensis]